MERRSPNNGAQGAANVFDIPGLSFGARERCHEARPKRQRIHSIDGGISTLIDHGIVEQFKGRIGKSAFAISNNDPNSADPAVAVNTTYGGIIAALWQKAQPTWNGDDPRAGGVIEFIATTGWHGRTEA